MRKIKTITADLNEESTIYFAKHCPDGKKYSLVINKFIEELLIFENFLGFSPLGYLKNNFPEELAEFLNENPQFNQHVTYEKTLLKNETNS
jgi:hypothetical protein